MKSIRSTVQSAIAAVLSVALIASTIGCTPDQQQTTLQVVTNLSARIPQLVADANTIAKLIENLDPADAATVGVADTAFVGVANVLQAQASAYLANPSAALLLQIQTQITSLEGQVNTALLSAEGIKNPGLQKAVIAALAGFATAVTVVLGIISPTLTASQIGAIAKSGGLQLARARPYMDRNELRREAVREGVPSWFAGEAVNRAFAHAESQGL